MGKVQGIIFDLDDTLYDEIDYVKSGYRKVASYLSELNNWQSEDIFRLFYERFLLNREHVFNYVLEQFNLVDEEILGTCLEIYRNHIPDIKLSAEIEHLLMSLKEQYKLGIITDGRPEGQWNKIYTLGLNRLVDEIIVTDELGGITYRKPHKLSYQMMAQKLELEINQLVYIGDNVNKDFIMPNQLGIYTIQKENNKGLYNIIQEVGEEYHARYKIKNLVELKEILMEVE